MLKLSGNTNGCAVQHQGNGRNGRFDLAAMIFSYMVVMIHSSYASFYHASGAIDVFLSDYYTDYLPGFAVPSFFMLSAIKFYRNYSYEDTVRKYKSRVNSLLIPYLAWNFLSVIWIMALSYLPIISHMIAGREKFTFTFSHLVGGPFWYLAMLMIFTLLCPVFLTLIRNKIVGVSCIIVLYLLDALPIPFPATTWPMFQWRTIVYCTAFYLIGAMIGRYGFDAFCKMPEKHPRFIAVCGYILAVALRGLTHNHEAVFIPAILIGFVSVWIFTGTIAIKHPDILSLSFFIYPAHTFVLPCVNKLLFLVLPKVPWMSIVNTVLGTALSYAICIVLGLGLRKILPPSVWGVLNGARETTGRENKQ